MKKGWRAVWSGLLCVCLVFFMPACSKDGASETALQGTFQIVTTDDYPPFEYACADGTVTGMDMELLQAIADDQGLTIQVTVMGFNTGLQTVAAGQADGMMAALSVSDKRKLNYDFSDPYYHSGLILAVRQDNADITDYAALDQKKVAVQKSTQAELYAQELRDTYRFGIVAFDTAGQVHDAVLNGECDACWEEYAVLAGQIAMGKNLKTVGSQTVARSQFAFAVAKGTRGDLLKKFNQGLRNIKDNGKYEEIVNRYVPKEITVK